MSKILPYTLMLAGAAYISLFGVPGLSGKASQESKSNAPVAGEASQSLQDLSLEQILGPQNAYAGSPTQDHIQQFEQNGWSVYASNEAISLSPERTFQYLTPAVDFSRSWKKNENNIRDVFSNESRVLADLIDGYANNDELQGVIVSTDNYILLNISTTSLKEGAKFNGSRIYLVEKQVSPSIANKVRSLSPDYR